MVLKPGTGSFVDLGPKKTQWPNTSRDMAPRTITDWKFHTTSNVDSVSFLETLGP